MELKCVVLVLTSLCVFFIAVEELFQSRLYSTAFFKSGKVHLVAAKPVAVVVNMEAVGNYDRSHVYETTHQPASSVMSDLYEYGDNVINKDRFSEELQHQLENEKLEKIHDDIIDADDNVNIYNRKEEKKTRWKAWVAKVHGATNKESSITKLMEEKSQKSLKEDLKQHLEFKENTVNPSEDEKLRLSPYIYHEEDEIERLKVPVEEKELKFLSYFLPWEKNGNQHSFQSCHYKRCTFIHNMSQADLVAFSASSIRDQDIFTFKRPPGQRWLMYTIDPSIKKGYNFDNDTIKSLFNATMTYNLDADIPLLFGRLRRVATRLPIYYDSIYEQKTKATAWFVSHCVTLSRREVYVQRMKTVIDVDIFGKCGNFTCGGGVHLRSQDGDVCLPMLTKDYKFYLAFENSFCLDYITEKFFKLFQDVQVIPVVRGGFHYKKYLPSRTFIDADDFETPEELAHYLIDLGNDKQRYTEMLRRKDEWRIVKMPSRECLLCEYLHSNPPNKFIPNLKEKFGRGSCWFPKKLELPN